MRNIVLLMWCMCVGASCVEARIRLVGDVADEQAETSFSFAIQARTFHSQTRQLAVGARDPITQEDAQPFAISMLSGDNTQFASFAPETVTLNTSANQTNPLHGAAIRFLDIIQSKPVAVAENNPNRVAITLMEDIDSFRVLQTDPLQDGNSADARDIIGLQAFGDLFAAAVRPSGDDFGASGSGIVFGAFGQQESNDQVDFVLQQFPAMFQPVETGRSELIQNGQALAQFHNDENQPVVFTQLPTGGEVAGFSVMSGSDPDAGARSIILGRSRGIIPESALKPDTIVGTDQPDTSVFVHNLDTLLTSTTLSYLVVNGGVGDADTTRRQVFALPLVNNGSGFGAVAARGVEPEPMFEEKDPFRFRGLALSQPADVPGNMWSPSDAAIRVGGNRDIPGPITDVWAEKDAVFVSVPEIDTTAELPAGVYYSQAMFNAHGRIIGWSDWTPTADTASQAIAGSVFDATSGQYTLFERDASGNIDTVLRTSVTSDITGLQNVSDAFTDIPGGIQDVNDIPFDHPALSDTSGERMAPIIATGLNTVVIAQSARDVSGILTPVDTLDLVMQINGGIQQTPADGYIIQGGALDDIGAIITSDIGTDGNYGWLVVGGSDGVAVLQANDGSGWPASGLQADFANMPQLAFKAISNISRVRRVTIDRNNCYILAEDALYRMPLSQSNLAQAAPQIYTIADAQELCDATRTFSDVIISGTRGILATSCGLFRVSTGVDVADITDNGSASWESFMLPESIGPVTRLYAVSPTHHERDIAKTPRGGAVYVISSAVSLFRTLVYRLAVTPESGVGAPTVDEFSLYPDYFTQRTVSYFISRGDYRNFVFSDGAIWLLSRSRYEPHDDPLIIEMMPSFLRSGTPLAGRARSILFNISPQHRVNQPLRVLSRGALMFHGDFGMYMQR